MVHFSPNTWQMMSILSPLDALNPNTPFSFFAEFRVRVTTGAQGSVLVGFWGGRQLSPFWKWGAGPARRLYRTPPPPANPPAQVAAQCTMSLWHETRNQRRGVTLNGRGPR